MPINQGRKGAYKWLGRPRGSALVLTGKGMAHWRAWRSPALAATNPVITGVTRDSAGVALGNCVVQLFRTLDDQIMFESVSDGSGNYTVHAIGSGPFYIVAYKAGSPDVAGTTVNTLTAD